MLVHSVRRKHGTLRAARKPNRHECEHEAVGKTVGKLHRAAFPPQQAAMKHASESTMNRPMANGIKHIMAKAENTPEMADSTKNGATMPIR